MNLDFLRVLALTGGDWVVYALLAASVVALAVILERGVVLTRETRLLGELRGRLSGALASGDAKAAASALAGSAGSGARILAAALGAGGRAAAEDRLAAAGLDERRALEARLLVLGTLGSNAPFVGLFGTVLGVIRAFHDLAEHAGAGPEVVMKGLSEALIATAVGLFVAIPCVIAYNVLQKKVADLLSSVEADARRLLAAGK
ncbi:MAG: MotA/TolQ/ExbB proton channel family protein [Elusimicrobia bacterium]|nr:MAG: MotA/TolQ/ExbB proton channel family protein [Elusimicrobiota bacterium]